MTQIEAMLLSIALEMPAAALFGFSRTRMIIIGCMAAASLGTCLTHPLVWHASLVLYAPFGWLGTVIAVEAIAVFGEWPVYALLTPFPWWRTLGISLSANAVSFLIGLLIVS